MSKIKNLYKNLFTGFYDSVMDPNYKVSYGQTHDKVLTYWKLMVLLVLVPFHLLLTLLLYPLVGWFCLLMLLWGFIIIFTGSLIVDICGLMGIRNLVRRTIELWKLE